MLLKLADWLVYSLMGLNPEAHHANALHFFIYDLMKIFLLLSVLIFLIGVARTYLPEDKLKGWMSKGGLFGNFVAALFGAITPFCSCSSIPLFISFLKAGAPLGVTFSFLVTSPLINEYLVILMLGTFGWKITTLYVAFGMGMGIAAGAIIHNYVPQESIHAVMEKTGIWSVPIATILGVPLYGSCAAIVPVAVVLFEKGIPLGTALAFMMAMAALSLPEAIMLRRVMKLSLIGIFFGVTTGAIIISGYLMNLVAG